MGAVKSYFHDQICEQLEEPGPEQDPEEQWWEWENSDPIWIAEQESEDGDS